MPKYPSPLNNYFILINPVNNHVRRDSKHHTMPALYQSLGSAKGNRKKMGLDDYIIAEIKIEVVNVTA